MSNTRTQRIITESRSVSFSENDKFSLAQIKNGIIQFYGSPDKLGVRMIHLICFVQTKKRKNKKVIFVNFTVG